MRAWWCRESVPSVDCIKWIWDKKSKVGGHGLGQALPLQPPPRPFFQALFGDKYKMKMEEVRVQSPSSWESMSSCWRWFDVNLVRNLGGMQYTLRCCGHGLGLVLGYLLSLHSCLYARKPFTMGLEIIPFVGAGGRIFFFFLTWFHSRIATRFMMMLPALTSHPMIWFRAIFPSVGCSLWHRQQSARLVIISANHMDASHPTSVKLHYQWFLSH